MTDPIIKEWKDPTGYYTDVQLRAGSSEFSGLYFTFFDGVNYEKFHLAGWSSKHEWGEVEMTLYSLSGATSFRKHPLYEDILDTVSQLRYKRKKFNSLDRFNNLLS